MREAARFLLLALLLLLAPCPPEVGARPLLADPHFERVGENGAITDNVVSALAVDPRGLLWIGTAVGLMHYDGHDFHKVEARDGADTLQNAFVRSLLMARDGRLWVGTDGRGLGVVDTVTSALSLVPLRDVQGRGAGTVHVMAEDAGGGIWAGTVGGGLHRVDPRGGPPRHMGLADGLPDMRIQALLVTPDGSLWVGTWKGLARLAPGATRFDSVALPEPLAQRSISLLHRDRRGRFWVGFHQGDLLVQENGSAWRALDRGGSEGSGHGAPQVLAEMEGGEIWIGRSGGVEIRREFDGSLDRMLRYSPARPWGPAGADVRSLVIDASGVLWMGSYGGGLQKHVPNGGAIWMRRGDAGEGRVLSVVDVRAIAQHPDGEVWVGTGDAGLAVLDRDLRTVAELRPKPGGYAGQRTGALAFSADGRTVYVASESQLALFDASSRRWLRNVQVGGGRLRVLRSTDDGRVLAGTQDGLHLLRPGASTFERLPLVGGEALTGDINALAVQPDGAVWVGGERGLFLLPPGGDALRAQRGVDGRNLDTVLGLLLDRRGHLWIDTVQGLYRVDRAAGDRLTMSFISERIGQAGRSFGANLLEDGNGRIWSHRGVYDPTRQQFDAIGPADGVDMGTGWFRSYVALRDGRMLFGGSRGLLVLEPQRFRPWRYAPPVVASSLRINGEAQPLARLHPGLVLQPHEHSFTVEYAVLDLSQPVLNRYRHRLKGLGEAWVEGNHDHNLASYSGVSPGRYQLQVQGSNRGGQWSPDTLMIPVQVLPAWWQTWWARALAGALLLVLLALLLKWRTRHLQAKQQQLEQRVAERTQQLEAARKTLESVALTDPLTGLHNRRFVAERLGDDLRLALRRLEEASRHGLPPPPDADLCFFLIDIDQFKEVNDRHGHAAGDAVLRQMRERLQQVFREADYLVRWGGEEFLVVARGTARDSSAELAERLRQAISERPFELPGLPPVFMNRSASIGFACWPLLPSRPRAVGWQAVVQLADAAMFTAKREGRDRWVGVGDASGVPVLLLNDDLGRDGKLPAGLRLIRRP